jgi:hypothetical protein
MPVTKRGTFEAQARLPTFFKPLRWKVELFVSQVQVSDQLLHLKKALSSTINLTRGVVERGAREYSMFDDFLMLISACIFNLFDVVVLLYSPAPGMCT